MHIRLTVLLFSPIFFFYLSCSQLPWKISDAKVFGDEEFLETAINAAEVVWNRGLLRRIGICHGVSGNAYVFLSLYRVTGNKEFLYKAKAFACFLVDKAHRLIAEGEMHGGESPYSLFEGIGGMAYLLLDMTKPTDAKFPGYELWKMMKEKERNILMYFWV